MNAHLRGHGRPTSAAWLSCACRLRLALREARAHQRDMGQDAARTGRSEVDQRSGI